jgi:hypothetical protein
MLHYPYAVYVQFFVHYTESISAALELFYVSTLDCTFSAMHPYSAALYIHVQPGIARKKPWEFSQYLTPLPAGFPTLIRFFFTLLSAYSHTHFTLEMRGSGRGSGKSESCLSFSLHL